MLDRGHGGDRRIPELSRKIFHLPLADPVLAGAGAVHAQGALDQSLAQGSRGLQLVGIRHVDQQ